MSELKQDSKERGNDQIARLIRLTHQAEAASSIAEARARLAVREEWQQMLRTRRRRRWTVGLAAAATLGLGLGIAWQTLPSSDPILSADSTVATTETLIGSVVFFRGDDAIRTALDSTSLLKPGSTVETDSTGRAALRLSNGQSLRIDVNSQVRLVSNEILELEKGAIYIDSEEGRSARGGVLEVRTQFGVVRDIGTQFEVRMDLNALRVRVREGLVHLERDGSSSLAAQAGGEFSVDLNGLTTTRTVPLHGNPWSWSLAVAPKFALEGKSLHEYLSVLGRETGWEVQFDDPLLELRTHRITLHGDLLDLPIEKALASVLETCGLVHTHQDGVVKIESREIS